MEELNSSKLVTVVGGGCMHCLGEDNVWDNEAGYDYELSEEEIEEYFGISNNE